MQNGSDHYELLGVNSNANAKEIKEAYRKLSFIYHPDRNQDSSTNNEKMQKINEAYNVLSNPIKRKEYDLPRGYRILEPKFSRGSRVRVNSHSATPYRDRLGVVDNEPQKDNFRFWYTVKFEVHGLATVSRFAEEELCQIIGE